MRQYRLPIIVPLVSFVLAIFVFWFPTFRYGSNTVATILLYFAIPPLFLWSLGAVGVAVIRLFNREKRQRALLLLVMALVTFVAIPLGLVAGYCLRMQAFHRLAYRSASLVDAIKKFEIQRGKPPDTLADLVPAFFPRVPSTGMGGYPEYNYFTGSAAEEYGRNRWALDVYAFGPGLKWDRFLYFPDQAYPETGFSGRLERIGDWAYVHE